MPSGADTSLANNDEARMPNVEEIPNAQMTNRDACLINRISSLFRHSSFGFRHWQATGEQEQEYEQEYEPAEIHFGL